MVHGDDDIRQDLKDIAGTREAMTKKLEMLEDRVHGTIREVRMKAQDIVEGAEDATARMTRALNPFSIFERNPLVVVSGVAVAAYLLGQYLHGRWNISEDEYAKPESPPVYHPATQHLEPYAKRLAS